MRLKIMNGSKHSAVLWTCVISIVAILVCVYFLYSNKTSVFAWNEPTAELRNVILGLAAVGGIPFLILGHSTRRSDLESKEKDLILKTETIINDTLIKQIQEASTDLTGIKIIMQRIGGSSNTGFDSKAILKYFSDNWKDVEIIELITIQKLINRFNTAEQGWSKLQRISVIFVNSIRLKNTFKNESLMNLISIQLVSNLSEDLLKLILFVTLISEFGHIKPSDGKISNSQLFMNEIYLLGRINLISSYSVEQMLIINSKFVQSEIHQLEAYNKMRSNPN